MTLSFLVATAAQVLTVAIIVRTLLSWFPNGRALARVSTALTAATEPILAPIRRRLPASGGLDLSPIVAIVLISVAESLVLGLLAGH